MFGLVLAGVHEALGAVDGSAVYANVRRLEETDKLRDRPVIWSLILCGTPITRDSTHDFQSANVC